LFDCIEEQNPEAVRAQGAKAVNLFLFFFGGFNLITFLEAITFNVGLIFNALWLASEHFVEGREDRFERLLGEPGSCGFVLDRGT